MMALGGRGSWDVPQGFFEHRRRGGGHTEGLSLCGLQSLLLWHAPARGFPGPWCWEPFPSHPREQVPRVTLAAGRSLAFVWRPIPPASSLPRSDGGRRWQAASPTCLTGRARVGAAAATLCLHACPNLPGPCRGTPCCSRQEDPCPWPAVPPCRDSTALPLAQGEIGRQHTAGWGYSEPWHVTQKHTCDRTGSAVGYTATDTLADIQLWMHTDVCRVTVTNTHTQQMHAQRDSYGCSYRNTQCIARAQVHAECVNCRRTHRHTQSYILHYSDV